MNDYEKIRQRREQGQEKTVKKALERFPYLKEAPSRFYTPLDTQDFDFLTQVGFPGEYPFTASVYPFDPRAGTARMAARAQSGSGLTRASGYSGYGTPEDTRDYYKQNISR